MLRTHRAGDLREEHIDQTVTLAGWVDRRRDHGGVAFIDLRDASGICQVVVREDVAHQLRSEFVLKITGSVNRRPEGNENDTLPTGAIEVIAEDVEVLNPSAALPFQISDHAEDAGQVGEEARLKYRYIDLRRSSAQKAIRLRSDVSRAARKVLDEHEFVEIETPTLTRSTPEGARDFLVPARLAPGSWYALPQSPQLFKQLLMVGGMERYYQIARCYRDEDFRAAWQQWLLWSTLLAFTEAPDELHAVTTSTADFLLPTLNEAEPEESSAEAEFSQEWIDLISDAYDDEKPLLKALAESGAPLPEVGEELAGLSTVVSWRDRRIAVLYPEDIGTLDAPEWTVLSLDDIDGVVAAVRRKES